MNLNRLLKVFLNKKYVVKGIKLITKNNFKKLRDWILIALKSKAKIEQAHAALEYVIINAMKTDININNDEILIRSDFLFSCNAANENGITKLNQAPA